MPGSWHGGGFLIEDSVGRGLAESAAFVVERYQSASFDRGRLQTWEDCLQRALAEVSRGGRIAADPDDGIPRVDIPFLADLARTRSS